MEFLVYFLFGLFDEVISFDIGFLLCSLDNIQGPLAGLALNSLLHFLDPVLDFTHRHFARVDYK